MRVNRLVPGILCAAAVIVAEASPTRAGGLRTGGAWESSANAAEERAGLAAEPMRPRSGELRLGFTPRGGLGLYFGPGAEGSGAIELDLGIAPARAGLARLEALALVPGGDGLGRTGAPERGLVVGGALAWSGWTLSGSFASGAVGTRAFDLWSGAVGYGPVTARLGYGETNAFGGRERALWLFGTELATGSWLTLEGDLAITDGPEGELATAGRIGLRLRF